jgi:phage baseplate assembly protein W
VTQSTQFAFPYRIGSRGRTASCGDDQHIRDLIEQLLMTSPGERVNRPTFGCGLLRMIFAPNSDILAAATQLLVQGQLQQWLGSLIAVDSVVVASDDAALTVTVSYVVRTTGQRTTARFVHPGP